MTTTWPTHGVKMKRTPPPTERRCISNTKVTGTRCQKPRFKLYDDSYAQNCSWHLTEYENARNLQLWEEGRQRCLEWLAGRHQVRQSRVVAREMPTVSMQDKPEPCWKCGGMRRNHWEACCV